MNLFPEKDYKFRLIGNQKDTLDRLKRRTDYSKYLTSKWTDKSFRGKIKENEFKIISSTIGKGAFCVMSGKINKDNSFVIVTINKAFKVLLGFLLSLPIIGMIFFLTLGDEKFELLMILSVIGQILMIRYIGINYFFRRFSKHSLNRLRDVLDIEWIIN